MIHIPPELLASVRATSDRHDAAHREAMRLAVLKPQPVSHTDRFDVVVETAVEVKVAHLEAATQLFEDYFADADWIDWTDFFDKLESRFGITVVDDVSGAAAKLQRHIREVKDSQ